MRFIIRNIVPFYALLLFVGYINLFSFYNNFDIEITYYFAPTELLLSFLPLTEFFFSFFGTSILFTFIIIGFIWFFKESNWTEKIAFSDLTFRIDYYEFRHKTNRTINDYKKAFKSLAIFLASWTMIFYLVIFLFYQVFLFTGWPLANISSTTFGILSLIWFILSYAYVQGMISNRDNKVVLIIVIGFISVISFILFSNKQAAYKIDNHEYTQNLEIVLKDSTIHSGDSLIFLGKTSQFFFLRNHKKKSSIIIANSQ